MSEQESHLVSHPSPIKRLLASNIDVMITTAIRLICAKILSFFLIGEEMKGLQSDIQAAIASGSITKEDPASLANFISQNPFALAIEQYLPTIFILIFISGALYYPIMESSKRCATFGKQVTKIIIIDKNGKKISFLQSITRYILNIVPLLIIIYIIAQSATAQVSVFSLFGGNIKNFILSLVPFIWFNLIFITKEKTTLSDILSNTVALGASIKK